MENDNIGKLYEYYELLSQGKDVSQCEAMYKEVLSFVQGSEKERLLVSQFIPRLFTSFPSLTNEAINAHLDLCEDTHLSIRKQAIKELPSFCRERTEYTKRLSDILAQLLQSEESSELSVVCTSLLAIIKINPKDAFLGIFNQVKNGDDRVREKCLQFLVSRLPSLPAPFLSSEVEQSFISELRSVLQDASSEEIPTLLKLFFLTYLGKTLNGKREVVNIVAEQIENEKPLNIKDEYIIERVISFIKSVKPIFSAEINSNRFLEYFCDEVIPKFSEISGCAEGSGNGLELLKLLAELTLYAKDLKNPMTVMSTIYMLLVEYLPLPSPDIQLKDQKLQFSFVECLIYSFHQLSKSYPEFFKEKQTSLKDLKNRLHYFARVSQVYSRTLDEVLKSKNIEDRETVDFKIQVVALKTISNINAIIKDFLYIPPQCKAIIKLSWMSVANPGKRKAKAENINHTTEKLSKHDKTYPKLYKPPNGKYSSNLHLSSTD